MFLQKLLEIYQRYQFIYPELIVIFLIFINFFIFFISKSENKARILSILSIAFLCFAMSFLPNSFNDDGVLLFNQMYLINKNNSIIKMIVIFGVILSHLAIVLMPKKDNGVHKFLNFELPVLMNFSLLGILSAISSNNFLVLYLSLELQALPGYILSAIKRDSDYSLEAGVKYFVLGVLSSAVFLYGVSLIYMSFGSVNYEVIADLLMNRSTELSILGLIGIIFIFFGLLFKLASAPLHTWIADVYQGVHSTVLMFFSIVPKLGIAYVTYILYHFVFVGKYFDYTTMLIGFFAFCSFFVGAISAIKQTNFKRLLAYSAIANSGFLLLNILGDLSYSFIGLAIYSFSYMIASYGLISFAMYYWNETNDENNYLIADLSGLAKTKPFLSISVAGLLFSIAGIPPFIGFFGKLYIVLSSVSSLHFALAFCALMSSVVSLVYYLCVIKTMYFAERNQSSLQEIALSRYGNLTLIYAIVSIISIFLINYFINFII